MKIAAVNRSTTARFAMRTFGTVRNDLNRAIMARTEPLASTALEFTAAVNTPIMALVKSGLD